MKPTACAVFQLTRDGSCPAMRRSCRGSQADSPLETTVGWGAFRSAPEHLDHGKAALVARASHTPDVTSASLV